MGKIKSEGQYRREGERLVRRARTRFPDMDAVDAVIAEARRGDVILPATMRQHRPSNHVALELVGSNDMDQDFEIPDRRLQSSSGASLPRKSDVDLLWRETLKLHDKFEELLKDHVPRSERKPA